MSSSKEAQNDDAAGPSASRCYSSLVQWCKDATNYDSDDNKQWRKVPASVRLVHGCIFVAGSMSLFAGLFFDHRFLLVGVPVMLWGALQEMKHGGTPFDMSKYE